MTKQFEKQFKNQSQSGRSMIEMLGVLAIIAILSIGGIVGFRLAMNYYQANQIAHEMNIMRTDAQIKIAQGAEELTLGDPYDSGNIQFNGYKTDFDCLYMETETSEPELASCAVANAYYIEMQKIPEGICKPLANLIDKMDNEIAFYINGKSVDAAEGEKGICLGENNILTVIFGADSDSEAIKCNDDPDCPENLPICLNHMCVECETDTDCIEKDTNNPICNKNTHMCEPCPKKSFWNGEKCQEGCRENKHCSENEYCYKTKGGTSCEHEWENDKDSGSCRKVKNDLNSKTMTVNGQTYYESIVTMNWWSAGRFCEALNKTPVTRANLGCENVSAENYEYCNSEIMNKLKGFVVTNDYWHWLDGYGTCYAYDIDLQNGQLSNPLYNKKNELNEFALCK